MSNRTLPALTVVVPCYNERDNVRPLVALLDKALAGIAWEVLFVDDNSPDGTAAQVHELAASDTRVRLLHRIGRRGLAGACIEGILSAISPLVAVMDGDLQHDETKLADMFAAFADPALDLAIGSRFVDGGSATGGLSAVRAWGSNLATNLARKLLKITARDPMSGFFMIRRELVDAMAPKLSTQGFKILLDIAATGHGQLRVAELPFTFGARLHGESKLDARVALDFAQLLLAKYSNDAISFRFVLFCLVGLSGVAVHMVSLYAQHTMTVSSFNTQQGIATFITIAWNFIFNNAFTYRDQRLTGWEFAKGLLEFELICAVGAISNVGIASLIYSDNNLWWIAGLGGALMGAVWNYAVSAAFVWRRH